MRNWFLAGILALGSCLPLAAQTEVKVIGIEYPPFITAAGDNGMSVELLRAALGTGYTVTLTVAPPNRAAQDFLSGKAPVSLFTSDYSKAASVKRVDNVNTNIVFFQNKTKNPVSWKALADLAGKNIAVTRSQTGQGPLIKALTDAGAKLTEVDAIEVGFKLLEAGRVDLVFSVDLTGHTLVAKLFPGNESLVPTDKPYVTIPGGPYFNTAIEGGEKLLADFKAGMAAIIKDGTAQKILEKYYGKGRVPANALVR